MTHLILFGFLLAAPLPAPGAHGHYKVLPAEQGAKLPFAIVDFTYGPAVPGSGVAWELALRAEDSPQARPLMVLRAVTSRDPLADVAETLQFLHYQLRIPEANETFEYVNTHTGRALLPQWGDFVTYFVPRPVRATRRQAGLPNSCEYLGHVLTLYRTGEGAQWPEWTDLQVLRLDPELLIGTGRNFRDAEGHRLPQQPQRQNYTYVSFTPDDYEIMLDAGFNLFTVDADQEPYVRGKPVFYIRNAGGKSPLRYPADLCRSNYAGPGMFIDEPTILTIGDKNVHDKLRYFTDAAALITKRVRAEQTHTVDTLERQLRGQVSFGDMRLAWVDYPSWETVYETAWYQLAGGVAGIVHEGRYQLEEFDRHVQASTGIDRRHTAEEMFKFVYAHLRGAARHFGGDWGMSIYGQADPKLSPLAMRMAYDRGARYLWYWTSDHDHHMPWPEQLELTRALRKHIAKHARPSIRSDRPMLDKVIVLPYGYFLTLEAPGDPALWWVRELDRERQNEASQRYRRLVTRALVEVHKALDAGEEFDITVDDGREPVGYRRVVRITDE